ncbi:hypothetical protein [uncultured Tolumonas sp.]|uniref:hypothetical protein n=1 Tax=uncultured Tolumonas sp. TaxID=263765 RepID=UPI002A0A7970|nr:hypothetical protein [uncultured Tolumonas sp.]
MTIILSILGAIFVYIQIEISSANLKLALYDKRLKIYESAVSLYQFLMKNGYDVKNHTEEIKKSRENILEEFTTAWRHSQVLFNRKDEIDKQMNTILNYFISATPPSPQNNFTSIHTKIEGELLILQSSVSKYIHFDTVYGWKSRLLETCKSLLCKYLCDKDSLK